MGFIKDWLTFFRIHTAPLTQGAFLIGYLLAGGILGSTGALIWILYGTLFHAVGFSMNNILDFPDDKNDPSKQHHPLVAGRINYNTAMGVVTLSLLLLISTGLLMVHNSYLASVLLFFCIFMGMVYNTISKSKLWAPIPISLTFGPLPAVSYFAGGGQPNTLIFLVVAYFTAQIWWQIAVSGYLKELLVEDQPNLLRKMGARTTNNFLVFGSTASLFIFMSAMLKPFFFSGLMRETLSWLAIVWGAGFLLIAICLSAWETSDGVWDRNKLLRIMALVEITTFFALLAVLAPLIGGLVVAVTLMIYFLVWYMAFNRIYWGTFLVPKV